MYSVGLLDNLRTRPGVTINRYIPTLPIERKPLPTLPPIVGDMRYIPTMTNPGMPNPGEKWRSLIGGMKPEPARCMAMTPECMGREKWERHYGSQNPGRKFLFEHLQERRRMANEAPRSEISEPNVNNPSTL